MRKVSSAALVVLVALVVAALAGASGEHQVTAASPTTPFSQNKQNEPAVAIDANHPNIVAAGANDNFDMEACNAGADNTCPFTPGVGVSGVYFSFDSGNTWTQPTYTGLSGRGCTGAVGSSDADCTAATGSIGTLPHYSEHGLVSDGDPALAFGPKPDASGNFSWSNGSRLYYANLTSNVAADREGAAFRGFEAIAVSRTDNVQSAASGNAAAWTDPVVISKQSSTTFSDKDQIWADNAASSRFFGNVYVCWASFRGQEKGNAAPAPLVVAVSDDGGDTWSAHQIAGAADNGQRSPIDGCTIRTDSTGKVYVFGIGTSSQGGHQAFEMMATSANGGQSWSREVPVAGPVTQPGKLDPVTGRPEIDGIAGARSDLAPAPSVDIANGAPTGTGATDRIVMSYVSGDVSAPHVYFTESSDGGANWSTPKPVEGSGDRGLYAAPAISPNGTDVYVVYNAFTTPYRTNTTDPRSLVGVVLHATVSGGSTGSFTEIHRSPAGDPRGSSQNDLQAEFLGDYVYAAATPTYGVAVWNDTRNAADCEKIDTYRASLQPGQTALTAPAPQQDCGATFGNSDIWSYTTG